MSARRVATDEDGEAIAAIALGGLVAGRSLEAVASDLRPFNDLEFPFLAATIADLAADALALAGATRQDPLSFVDVCDRHLPDHPISGNTAHQKMRAAIHVVVMVHAGIKPDYGDVAGWWRVQDLGYWTFIALVIALRISAERTGVSVEALCRTVAEGRSVQL